MLPTFSAEESIAFFTMLPYGNLDMYQEGLAVGKAIIPLAHQGNLYVLKRHSFSKAISQSKLPSHVTGIEHGAEKGSVLQRFYCPCEG